MQKDEFWELLLEKLVDADAPNALIDALRGIRRTLYSNYSVHNPADIQILNEKTAYIVDLAASRPDPESEIPSSVLDAIKLTMRVK